MDGFMMLRNPGSGTAVQNRETPAEGAAVTTRTVLPESPSAS